MTERELPEMITPDKDGEYREKFAVSGVIEQEQMNEEIDREVELSDAYENTEDLNSQAANFLLITCQGMYKVKEKNNSQVLLDAYQKKVLPSLEKQRDGLKKVFTGDKHNNLPGKDLIKILYKIEGDLEKARHYAGWLKSLVEQEHDKVK